MAEKQKPYVQMSARIGVDEIFFSSVMGWIVGALTYIVGSILTYAPDQYPQPHEGQVFLAALTAALAVPVLTLEIKIRRRQGR